MDDYYYFYISSHINDTIITLHVYIIIVGGLVILYLYNTPSDTSLKKPRTSVIPQYRYPVFEKISWKMGTTNVINILYLVY